MELVHVITREHTEFLDITDRLAAVVERTAVVEGILNVQALHTTTALVLNELEPLLLTDFAAAFERLAPRCSPYHHDDFRRRTTNLMPDERVNGHAHCRALFLSPNVCLNVADGRLVLGRWQRVLLAELDGPRERAISVVIAPTRLAAEPSDHARDSWTERRFSEALGR